LLQASTSLSHLGLQFGLILFSILPSPHAPTNTLDISDIYVQDILATPRPCLLDVYAKLQSHKQSPATLASLLPGLANHRSKLLLGCSAGNISLTFPPPLLTSPPYAQQTPHTLIQGLNEFLQVPSGGDPTNCLQLIPTYLKHCEISCLINLGEPTSAIQPMDVSIIQLQPVV